MSSKRFPLLLTLAVTLLGLAAAAPVALAASKSAVIKIATVTLKVNGKTSKHSALVTSAGKPVYLLTGDSSKSPKCESATCLGNWPAVTSSSSKPVVGSGVSGKVGVWHHNGINQLTLNGHPLYTFAGDSSADVANGEDLTSDGGTWEVLAPSGSAVSASSKSSSGSGW